MESNTWQLAEIVQSIYEAPTYHLILEAALFVWVLWLILFRQSYKPKTEFLTEKVTVCSRFQSDSFILDDFTLDFIPDLIFD